MTELIAWITGCAVVATLILSGAYLINVGMQNDVKLRSECIAAGGVYGDRAGCMFSKKAE